MAVACRLASEPANDDRGLATTGSALREGRPERVSSQNKNQIKNNEVWLSLVERYVRDVEVASSNLVTSTSGYGGTGRRARFRF